LHAKVQSQIQLTTSGGWSIKSRSNSLFQSADYQKEADQNVINIGQKEHQTQIQISKTSLKIWESKKQ